MAAGEIHQNDVGTIIRTLVKLNGVTADLSWYYTKYFIFLKPNGQKLTKDVEFYTNGTDGLVQYTTQSGDLDITGIWRLQLYLENQFGNWKTDCISFKVHENI